MTQELVVAPCSHVAAVHAVRRWHYSRSMPAAAQAKFGVWENARFVGAIIYGAGVNRNLARPFDLEASTVCELMRVALGPGREHPTSRCLALSLKRLKRYRPDLELVVSYADTKEGHLGTIYQATNWIYLGAMREPYIQVRGRLLHKKTLYARWGPAGQRLEWLRANVDAHAKRVLMPAKHKYVWAFDKKVRRRLLAVARPYPKRGGGDEPDAGDGGTPCRDRAAPSPPSASENGTVGRAAPPPSG